MEIESLLHLVHRASFELYQGSTNRFCTSGLQTVRSSEP